jgi:nucleoside-diphosphate-sugar epimerase
VLGDGRPWRPVVHVKDVARAFAAVLDAPREAVHNEAFNTGAEHLNRQVGELARIAAEAIPGCEVEVLGQAGADRRTYRADFAKWARTFPDCEFERTPERGAREVREAFESIDLEQADVDDRRFTRLAWLRHLLDTHALDSDLRWSNARVAA